ncbi:MAG: hypothetical protein OXF42_04395 [Candidatus Dadabacteria bacterium]|nr:hypothetical protein [Candidatus Dadabacteria bacterium]
MNFNHKHNSGFLRGAVAILAIALAAALLPGGGEKAAAGTCTRTGPGTWDCRGLQNDSADSPITVFANSGETLSVGTSTGTFGVATDTRDNVNPLTVHARTGSLGGAVNFRLVRIPPSNPSMPDSRTRSSIYNTRSTGNAVKVINDSDHDLAFNLEHLDSEPTGDLFAACKSAAVLIGNGAGDVILSVDGTAGISGRLVHGGCSGDNAITATHGGAGDLDITIAGIVADNGGGISANHQGAGSVVINSRNVNSSRSGISVNHQGSGSVIINSGSVNVTDAHNGIAVETSSTTDSVTINATDLIFTRGRGIDAEHRGTGAVVINSNAVQAEGIGINLETSSTVSGVTINAIGRIGGTRAINAVHQGTGSVVINSGGGTSTSETGINVETSSASADALTITTTGDILSNTRAINATHSGTGDLTVNATGLIRGSYGISANHQGSGSVVINSRNINAVNRGIDVETSSTAAAVTVNATGDIFATDRNFNTRGINIGHSGTGAVVVHSSGAVNSGGRGISVETSPAVAGGVTVNATGDIFSESRGINISHQGAGAVVINSGNINAESNGINVENSSATAAVTINAIGDILTRSRGISVSHEGSGAVVINSGNINVTDDDASDTGINVVTTAATGAVTINATGDITTERRAINATHRGGGDFVVNIPSGVSVTSNASAGILIVKNVNDGGSIIVDVEGSVVSNASSPVAINITNTGPSGGSSSNHVVRLRPGFSIEGEIQTAGSREDSTLELADATSPSAEIGRVNFNELGFPSTDIVRKTGSSTWEVTGAMTQRLDSFSIEGGTLALTGDAAFNAQEFYLNSAATMLLTESANVALGANFVGNGGRLILSANFEGNTPNASRLSISHAVTGITPIDLQISGAPNAADLMTLTTTPLISASGADEDNFQIREAAAGIYTYTLNYIEAEDAWRLVQAGLSSASGVIESYAATLAKLSSLSSMRQRLEGRVRAEEAGEKEETGIWGRIEGSLAEFEPGVSTTGSTYEIQDARIRFGADVPLEDTGLTFGGNIWFGLATTDISPANGKIETNGYAAAITAAFERNDFYADGQFQYALFSGDLSAPGLAASGSDATALSASAEVGYGVPVGGVNITPQAQVVWVSADFDDINIGGQTASLEDGGALTGRVGVFVDRELKGSESEYGGNAGEGSVYAGLNLLVPLDGETAARVGGENLTSELEEIAGDFSVGGSYSWGGKHSIFGEAAVSLGSEVMEYRANVGLSLGF